jgi:signal transduction histidine kinase
LLAITLLPLLVMLPLSLLVLAWWGDNVYDRLLITKVRSDLAVAHGYFDQVMERVGARTRVVADSHALVQIFRTGSDEAAFLEQQRNRLELDFLVLLPVTSESPGSAVARTTEVALWSIGEWEQVRGRARASSSPSPSLAKAGAGNDAHPAPWQNVLVIVSKAPVLREGKPVATVMAGILLNDNLPLVDRINSIVYPEGSLPFGSQGTASLFMHDVRIATNVTQLQGKRAIGTSAAADVSRAVLGQGQTWLNRAFVVKDWYVSGYEPLRDGSGKPVGMLYVGYLEQPLRLVKWSIFGAIGAVLLSGTLLTLLWSLRWARSIFQPLERMSRTIEAVEEGNATARVGSVQTHDEVGLLAEHLDRLLDVVEENTHGLQRAAEDLEKKVADRTRELASSNESLKDAQKQLIQSEKLATIGQLTAGIAHEINNPVAVMQGNLDLVRELLGPDAKAIDPELRLLDDQVGRMRVLVNQLLQFARPSEFGAYVEPLKASAVMDECLILASHMLSESSIRVVKEYTDTRRISFSRQELQQLLLNLITNAIQAMAQGGILVLRTHDCAIGGKDAGVGIDVQDNGPGLPAQIRDQLFLPQVTTRPEGNGLGLWICLGLVERYGGTIKADNVAGGGALFRIRLPATPP